MLTHLRDGACIQFVTTFNYIQWQIGHGFLHSHIIGHHFTFPNSVIYFKGCLYNNINGSTTIIKYSTNIGSKILLS